MCRNCGIILTTCTGKAEVSLPTLSVHFACSIRSELAKALVIKSLWWLSFALKSNPRFLLNTSRFYQRQISCSPPSLHHLCPLSSLFITLQHNWLPFCSCSILPPFSAPCLFLIFLSDFCGIFPIPCMADSFLSFKLQLNYYFSKWPLYPKSAPPSPLPWWFPL